MPTSRPSCDLSIRFLALLAQDIRTRLFRGQGDREPASFPGRSWSGRPYQRASVVWHGSSYGKKLLLVGDEIRVLDWLDTQLSDAGFDVVVAGNGVHALAELEANGTRFAALVTAINLGSGPDGWEVRA
jgi:hypothetical protein